MDALLFFVLAVLAVFLAVFLVSRGRGLRTPTAEQLGQRLENVRAMSGVQFELFMADLFRAMGHKARVLGGSGDQGVDLIVDYKGERVAVQCKNYGKAVGNKPVQEVYAGSRYHGCNSAWVVAPSGFTKGAVELARRVGVSLYDAQAIRTWIRRVDERERDRGKKKPAPRMRRIVDLDAASTARKEDTALESGMEKHTIYVGMYNPGETVAFTAKLLGTAPVNGGKGAERGADCSYYRLPDHTYRVLISGGDYDVTMLQPSNIFEAWRRGEPVEYGSWTLEELHAQDRYGQGFRELMKNHPETKSVS
jgi:HJR/Mrr/RecB family endonuclease